MITIVGMGVGQYDVTLNAINVIKGADVIFVRSEKCASSAYFKENKINVRYFDDLFEDSSSFSELNERIVSAVLAEKDKNVVYCVSGSGIDDGAAAILKEREQDVSVLPGVSAADSALTAAGVFTERAISSTASEFMAMKGLTPDTDFAFVLTEMDDRTTAGEVKLSLGELYGDETDCYFVHENGSTKIKIADIDRMNDYNYTTAVVIPAQNWLKKDRYSLSDLLRIIYALKAPDGCPWDRVQTHMTIRSSAVEEAYELVEAVELNDIEKMIEESGDVILQGFFHAVIAEDDGEFTYTDVLTNLCKKLIFRHPHVFGDVVASNSAEALASWDSAKTKEKKYNSYTEKMDGIAKTLPPATIAMKLQKIAKKANFDWDNVDGAVQKVSEELKELLDAPEAEREGEGGDLLFAVVNVLRFLDVDPDLALNRTNAKFRRRFAYVESEVLKSGREMKEVSLDELDGLWNQAKAKGL